MSVHRNATPARIPRRTRTAADIANDVLAFIARLAALVFCASLAYLAYVSFGGILRTYPSGFTQALSNQLTHNVQLASQALLISGIVGSLCLIALLWGWEWAWLFFGAVGGILYGVLPYFAVPFLSAPSVSILRRNHPGADLLGAWRSTGLVLIGTGALFVTGWIWDRLQTSLAAPRRAGGRLKVPFYSACWQTHYCKDEINKLCAPGRKGYHASCWRYKSGCICDESIADRMLSDARKKMGADAAKWLGAPSKAPAPTFADRLRSTHHAAPFQTVACADCPIYGFHEVQKHRIMAPVVILTVPAIMVFKVDSLHGWYAGLMNAVDRFTLRLAFDPSHTAAVQSQIHGALDVPVMEWVVYAAAALALITVGARVLEFWCFQAKL